MVKPKVAIHKFSSCDGCQLAFLNAGEKLLELASLVDIVHFAEAGPYMPDANVEVSFIEGSISTREDIERVKKIRERSQQVVTLGACATAGGIQALRNMNNHSQWLADIYAQPEYIDSLDTSTAIKDHIKVDFEVWGCPVNTQQVFQVIRQLLLGVKPVDQNEKICMECKRSQTVCVMVTSHLPCMGPVTRTGCGAICPKMGRACYACFGPGENSNAHILANRFEGLGLLSDEISKHFLFINNQAEEFYSEGKKWLEGQSTGSDLE